MSEPSDEAWLELRAPAKVNLNLHVTGLSHGGYHLLESVVAFADAGDRLWIRRSDQLSLALSGPFAHEISTLGKDNLILRALHLLLPKPQFELRLEKNLPPASGIGGGTSDAAAALIGAVQLTKHPQLSLNQQLSLGADLPICLLQKRALMLGIGEDVSALPQAPALAAVLVNPRIAVPTSQVFQELQQKTNPPLPPLPRGGLGSWMDFLKGSRNDLEAIASHMAPVIHDIKRALLAQPGCALARMSGSGATVFGLFAQDFIAASAAAEAIHQTNPHWWCKATWLH